MIEEYVEKVSDSNTVVRVNAKKGTFLVIREGKPLPNPSAKTKSIIHRLPSIIFLGTDFDLKDIKLEKVSFFPASDGFLQISFKEPGLSDIRHVMVELGVIADLLPAKVFFYSNYKIGMLPKTIQGAVYFIIESQVDREGLIRLKTVYPQCKIAIYKREKVTKLTSIEQTTVIENFTNVRATDLVKQSGAEELAKNPTFLARIYLRKLEWTNMRNLPYKMLLKREDSVNISTFLKVMLKNENNKKELDDNKPSIKTLEEFYNLLTIFLSYDKDAVEEFFSNNEFPTPYKAPLIKVLESQHRQLGKEADEDFFSYVLKKLSI